MEAKVKRARAKATGRYTYEDRWERLCVCGRTLGIHDAEAPHPAGDASLDPEPGMPECERFRPSRAKKGAEG